MNNINDLSTEPKHTIKTVSQKTGILPVTIRAWEQRYALLEPQRAKNRYRLYSDRDVAVLKWIKRQVERGTSISTAVRDLQSRIKRNDWPDVVIEKMATVPSNHCSKPPEEWSGQLFGALIKHDEDTASRIFAECLDNCDVGILFESVITPCLVEIGEGWYRGEIQVATEHYASSFLRAKLMTIFQNLPLKRAAPLILVGGSPGELHEMGSLMIAILLRSIGFQVEYLGPDLPLEDLAIYAGDEKPGMIILSATLEESTRGMIEFRKMLEQIHPQPKFGFGGGAFVRNPRLVNKVPGHYLGNSLTESIKNVQGLLPAVK